MTEISLHDIQSIPEYNKLLTEYDVAVPVDQFRQYDLMIETWLKKFRNPEVTGTQEPSTESVPVINGTPNRAWSSLQILIRKEKNADERRVNNVEMIPLPWIDFYRTSVQFDATRFNRGIAKGRYQNDEDKKAIWLFPYPVPYTLGYNLDFWSTNRTTKQLMEQWVLLQFDHSIQYLYVDLAPVNIYTYGNLMVLVRLNSLNDSSNYTAGREDIEYRFTVQLEILGWIMRPAALIKTVHDYEYSMMFIKDFTNNWVELEKFCCGVNYG